MKVKSLLKLLTRFLGNSNVKVTGDLVVGGITIVKDGEIAVEIAPNTKGAAGITPKPAFVQQQQTQP